MEISVGRLRLHIARSRATQRCTVWEEAVAVGMDDHELARINRRNKLGLDGVPWQGLHFIYGGGRRP